MSPHFNKVRYKAYQIDEGPDFDDGRGPPPPTTSPTLDCYILFPSATLGVAQYDPTVIWMGKATDTSDAVAGQIQGVFPFLVGSDWLWAPLYGGASPAGLISPDTWYHIVLSVTQTDIVTGFIDYTFTVDGSTILTEMGVETDISGVINQIGVGADGTGAVASGATYIDDVHYDDGAGSTFDDDFEGGTLGSWDDQTGDVTVDTVTFHGGAKSLKANQTSTPPNIPAFVVKAV